MFTKHFVFKVECAARTLMTFLFICVRLTETGECRKPNFLDVFANLCFVNQDLVKDSSLHGGDRVLASSFRDWKFAPRQLLHETFPIDPIMSNYVREVRNVIISEVRPTPFKTKLRLVAVSEDSLVNILNMDPSITKSSDFVEFVGGSYLHGDAIPLAHRYGGHQFGSWAGQLGDGRAVMLGEFINSSGERWELQLKGSGLTPYSRRGDGRAVLRSSVREFLCSEAMHYLGIPTSRAAALVVSDDSVIRDQFYNGNIIKERGAIVLRIAKSWFRIGSLELLAYHNEINLLKKLVDFVIQNYFPSIDNQDESKYLQFYSAIVSETAALIAKWQSVGFAHGVCNTDNFSLLSITIDYGPFGFLDSYDPRFVPNTSDDEGMYSYEGQPDVGAFNLDKLRLALLPLLSDEQKALSITIHKGYADIYKREFMAIFRQKLGLFDSEEDDEQLVAVLLKMMEETGSDFTMTFRQLGEISISDLENNSFHKSHWALMDLQKHDWFSSWVRMYARRIKSSNRSEIERQTLMNSVNPRYILRNWIAQHAISLAEGNNFDEVKKVLKILQNPFQQQSLAESGGFADRPPPWSKSLKVSCSS